MPRISVSSEFFSDPLVLQVTDVDGIDDPFIVIQYLTYVSGGYDNWSKRDRRLIERRLAERGFGKFVRNRFVPNKPPLAQEDGKPMVFVDGEGQ